MQEALKVNKKPKRAKRDGKPKRLGPNRAVSNQRSVMFNLELDVHSLHQELHDMASLRDILRTRTLLQRHSPEGSLMHVVKEYFHVFRAGSVLRESGRKRLMDDQDQHAFMHSIVDAQVDVGNGLHGPDVMMDQMTMYSTFIKFIRLTMHSFDIVVAEDSVVVTTNATLRFEIVRATIEMIFPHVVAEEWLVSQLVGQQVEPYMGITFYFNPAGKCCKYEVDLDFVGEFTSIVKDPEMVNTLLGRALIAENCMFGVIDEAPEPEEEGKPAAVYMKTLQDERDSLARQINDLRDSTRRQSGASLAPASKMVPEFPPPSDALTQDIRTSCLQSVEDYYNAFANGYQADDDVECAGSAVDFQRRFLLRRLVPETTLVNVTGATYVAQRWRSLCECFSVLSFHQKAVGSVEYDRQADTCDIRSSARYILSITATTMGSVFPHVKTRCPLYAGLSGKVLAVPSQINFSIESDTGRIRRIEERMDFAMAMAKVVPSGHDLQFALSKAKLVADGVSCRNEVISSAFERSVLGSTPASGKKKRSSAMSTSRTMRLEDILN